MSAAGRQALIALLGQEYTPDAELSPEHLQAWLPGMVEAICMSPEFQTQ